MQRQAEAAAMRAEGKDNKRRDKHFQLQGEVLDSEMRLVVKMFVLVPLYVEPGVKSVLLSSLFLTLFLTFSLSGFINRPLCFLCRPQRT